MDIQYEVSTSLLIIGYVLFAIGICAHAWKFETGYDFGLWCRCDSQECVFYSVDYLDYLNGVRVGIVLSSLLFLVSCICLVAELVLMASHSDSRHRRRLGKTAIATAILSELLASACLGVYGTKTLFKNEKLPSLKWGFAITGVGVIVCFLGTILRMMGPVSTWYKVPCLVSKSSKQNSRQRKGRNKSNRPIYRYKGENGIGKANRPTAINLNQPSDVIVYRKVSEGSYQNLSPFHQDHQHRYYEELNLKHDNSSTMTYNNSRKNSAALQSARSSPFQSIRSSPLQSPRSLHRPSPAFSYQPSPTPTRDLSPRTTSSLPPGMSPGFYPTKNHYTNNSSNDSNSASRQRENNYGYTVRNPRVFSPRVCHPQQQHRFQTLPVRPLPHNQQQQRALTIDTASIFSEPIARNDDNYSSSRMSSPFWLPPSPVSPPSPPLPPPPPSLVPNAVETVSVRPMNGTRRQTSIQTNASTNSLQSFGSSGY